MFLKKDYSALIFNGKKYKGGEKLPKEFIEKYGEQFKDRITDGKEAEKNVVKTKKAAKGK